MNEDESLLAAISNKDAKALKAALASGADAETRDKEGNTALLAAIAIKSKACVKALIEGGADVNARGRDGWTPLIGLAENLRDVKIAGLLLDKGADPNLLDEERFSKQAPLHRCLRLKKLEFAAYLVERGANLEQKEGYEGRTPLLHVLKADSGVLNNNERAAAFWLLDCGADINATSENGATPLHLAAESGAQDVVERLLSMGAKPTANQYGGTPLHYVVSTHDKCDTLWETLIAAGNDVNARKKNGETPLLTAQMSWNDYAVSWFLRNGADPDATDEDGKTALDRARDLKQPKVIKALGG